jgi:hypothetical protein
MDNNSSHLFLPLTSNVVRFCSCCAAPPYGGFRSFCERLFSCTLLSFLFLISTVFVYTFALQCMDRINSLSFVVLAHYCLVIKFFFFLYGFCLHFLLCSVWIEFLWVCSCTSLVSFFSTVLHFTLESIDRVFELFVHAHLLWVFSQQFLYFCFANACSFPISGLGFRVYRGDHYWRSKSLLFFLFF